jgi:hypothetical protein
MIAFFKLLGSAASHRQDVRAGRICVALMTFTGR